MARKKSTSFEKACFFLQSKYTFLRDSVAQRQDMWLKSGVKRMHTIWRLVTSIMIATCVDSVRFLY